jgi:hypothetical protein
MHLEKYDFTRMFHTNRDEGATKADRYEICRLAQDKFKKPV